jgi:putative lipoic acid-binding regulatory protein
MTNKPTILGSDAQADQTLMEFPLAFPLKVFGHDRDELEQVTIEIICEHVPGVSITEIKARPSKTGKYTALTLTFLVEHKQQLDRIYLALSEHNAVVMTL